MNFSVKVNSFLICVFVSSEAKDWLCPVERGSYTAHEYICRTTNDGSDEYLEKKYCYPIIDGVYYPPTNFEVIELKLKQCQFKVISSCLTSYKNLTSLDISYSKYETLESLDLNHKFLKKLNASHNIIDRIPKKFLANLPEIIEVDFSYNKLKTSKYDTNIAYEGLDTNTLKRIFLSHNEIKYLSNRNFVDSRDLEYIDFSHNFIHEYESGIFNKNTKLKVVHLESNRHHSYIPVIPFATSVYISWKLYRSLYTHQINKTIRIVTNGTDEGLFQTSSDHIELHCNEHSFDSVKQLNIGPNQIENLPDLFDCFGNSTSLQRIFLTGSSIRKLNSTIFLRFPNLILLNLCDTELQSFDFALLQHLPELEVLDISKNDLSSMSNIQLLSTFESLTNLYLVDNGLSNIPEIIDSLGAAIEVLELSGNFVGDISRINFGRFKNLLQLGLRNTSLQLGDKNPFDQNTKLTTLDISSNNLSNWNYSTTIRDLSKLQYFNASKCQIKFSNEMIKHFGNSLNKIDLSNNFVLTDELRTSSFNASHFYILNLANMGMKKIEFDSKLSADTLNISFNQLTQLNFTHELYMKMLYVEGNNITKLINFDKLHLPQLESLNIENNIFSCEYLVQLLERIKIEWPNLELKGDSYKQKHGQDCHPYDQKRTLKHPPTGIESMNVKSFEIDPLLNIE